MSRRGQEEAFTPESKARYQEMLATGEGMAQKWQETVDGLKGSRAACRDLLQLARTRKGRAAMRAQRQKWEIRGFVPPWEPVLGPIDQEPDRKS